MLCTLSRGHNRCYGTQFARLMRLTLTQQSCWPLSPFTQANTLNSLSEMGSCFSKGRCGSRRSPHCSLSYWPNSILLQRGDMQEYNGHWPAFPVSSFGRSSDEQYRNMFPSVLYTKHLNHLIELLKVFYNLCQYRERFGTQFPWISSLGCHRLREK